MRSLLTIIIGGIGLLGLVRWDEMGGIGAWQGEALRDTTAFASFVEPGFPFITTTVDAQDLAPGMPAENLTVRGLVLQLGNSAYAAFDPDLLRMAVGWEGEMLSLTTMAQVSYHEALNKSNGIPRVLGRPLFGTGHYPGWRVGEPRFSDPRAPGPNPEDVGRGPIPVELGRWNGLYVVGRQAVLSYTVGDAEICEQPGSIRYRGAVGITRTFQVGRTDEPLTLAAAEISGGTGVRVAEGRALVFQGADRDTVTAVAVEGAPDIELQVVEDRYVTVSVPAGDAQRRFRLTIWKGPAAQLDDFEQMLGHPIEMVDFAEGGPAHWPGTVPARGHLAPDTSAFVVDRLALPLPNPWRRNVRVAGLDFFEDGRAALVTFDGDVWLLSGIDRELQGLRWKRFASGLYEPLSLRVVGGEVYIYGREGIVRLHDLNGDGEADFYENFSNLPVQSTESREWPLSMVEKPGGGFYLSIGGALNSGPSTSEPIMRGFRAGSWHSGSVIEVSEDGRTVRVVATGFREPGLGVHPKTGFLTATDQQGNFVPSTPLYVVRKGGFYGVPATAHREGPLPEAERPLAWIPHPVDRSGAGQVWITSDQMGPLSGRLVHLSYGRPGLFQVLIDSTTGNPQGALVPLPGTFPAPILQGAVRPVDGQLYLAGFQIYGSQAQEVSGLTRLRYTGRPSALPADVRTGRQGLIVRFHSELDAVAAADPARYRVRRWNYRRTEQYGSGHYRLDGSAGQEVLPVAAAHLSRDGRAVLLVLPDMQEAMQMTVSYALQSEDGRPIRNELYLSPHALEPLDLEGNGFEPTDWEGDLERLAATGAEVGSAAQEQVTASADLGWHLYQEVGCVGCHSIDGTQAGKVGPTLKGLYGAQRRLSDGTEVVATMGYLKQAILEPSSQVVAEYEPGMPSYQGVLGEAEVQSLVFFIRSLGR